MSQTLIMATAIWSAVGPLVGVLVGATLANRIQRQHWLAGNKKAEYRELLSAMTEAFGEFLFLSNTTGLNNDNVNAVQVKIVNTIHNRIFTSDEVIVKLKVFERWVKATATLREGDKMKFAEMVGDLLDDVRKGALKDITKRGILD